MKKIILNIIIIVSLIAIEKCAPTLPEKEPWVQINYPDPRAITVVGKGAVLTIYAQSNCAEMVQIILDDIVVKEIPLSGKCEDQRFITYLRDFGKLGVKDLIVKAINKRAEKVAIAKIDNNPIELRRLAIKFMKEEYIIWPNGMIRRLFNLSNGPYPHPIRVRVCPPFHNYLKGIEEGLKFWKNYTDIDYKIELIDWTVTSKDENNPSLRGYVYISEDEKYEEWMGLVSYFAESEPEIKGGVIYLSDKYWKPKPIYVQSQTVAHELGHLLGFRRNRYGHDPYHIMTELHFNLVHPHETYALRLAYERNPGDILKE